MEIALFDETKRLDESSRQLVINVLEFVAQKLEVDEDSEVSVTIVDNEKIRRINKEYRNKDYATDVISFAIEDVHEDELLFNLDEDLGLPRELGDLFVSLDKTKEQAEEYNHSFERELGFLVVHGFLHLNGYDHMNQADEKEMFSLQEKLLKEFGLGK